MACSPTTPTPIHSIIWWSARSTGWQAMSIRPIAGTYGTLTLHADGSYTYMANNSVVGVGVDNFFYTADDGHGQTSTAELAITVTGANQNYVQVPAGGSATTGYSNTVLDGSAGNATLTAAATLNAHQILIGGPGDTLNAASYGQDTFVFTNNFGHDTINNFQPALDVIQLQQSVAAAISPPSWPISSRSAPTAC